MKILQFILPVGLGGVERIVSMLFQYNYNNSKDEVYIAIGASYKDDFCKKFKISTSARIIPVNDKNIWSAFFDIKKIIKKLRPDVIHTHARRECFLASLLSWSIRHVRTQHMAENPNVKVSLFEKKLLHRNVDVWISTSKNLADNYLKRLQYIDKEKIKVIYNGINVNMALPNHEVRNYKFCIISRLSKQKGIDILFKRLYEMPMDLQNKISIDLWGEGEEKKNLLNLIDHLNLQGIVSYKGVTYTPIKILPHYDALLMPSRYEGLPLTMLESMAVKTPVAIHNVGCVSEFLETSINGWIIDSSYSWKSFFQDVLNPEYDLEYISNNAMETYNKKFVGNIMCNKYYQIYHEV